MAYLHALTRTSAVAEYWAAQSKYTDTIETVQPAENLGCSRLSVVFTRTTPAGTRDDVMVFGIALADIVGGGLYGVLNATKMAACETALDAVWTDLKTIATNQVTLTQYRWHEHRANHPASEKGYETIGPATRLTNKSVAGSLANSRHADQVTPTVTWRTTSRKHWGRIYVPGISLAVSDTTYGRIGTAAVDQIANAWHVFEAACNTAAVQLGVWTWKYQAFLPLSELRVDNVWDIQRRRRAKQSNYAKAYVA